MAVPLTVLLMARSRLYTLFAATLIFLLVFPAKAKPQQVDKPKVVDWSGGYFSSFYLLTDDLIDAPRGIEEFESISVEYLPNQEDDERLLMPNKQGEIMTAGKLFTKDHTIYKFRASRLIEGGSLIKLKFVTETVRGINFSFEGEYLKDYTEVRRDNKIVDYVHLKGTLTKYNNGRKVAQAELRLTPHWVE